MRPWLGMWLAALWWTGLAGAVEGPSPPVNAPQVHIVEGMWSQLWDLPGALRDSCVVSESFLCSRYGFATWLKGFPTVQSDLNAHQAVILANIPADAFSDQPHHRSDAWIEDYLAQGGGVLLLGGNYALGTGGNAGRRSFGDIAGTAYERILPVQTHDHDIDLEQQNRPLELMPAGTHPILAGIDWSDHPVTMFYHEVAPRGDAQVLVTAGGHPILIIGTYKGGRIALWTATVQGQAPAGATECWRWKQWPRLVRNITTWLTSGH